MFGRCTVEANRYFARSRAHTHCPMSTQLVIVLCGRGQQYAESGEARRKRRNGESGHGAVAGRKLRRDDWTRTDEQSTAAAAINM